MEPRFAHEIEEKEVWLDEWNKLTQNKEEILENKKNFLEKLALFIKKYPPVLAELVDEVEPDDEAEADTDTESNGPDSDTDIALSVFDEIVKNNWTEFIFYYEDREQDVNFIQHLNTAMIEYGDDREYVFDNIPDDFLIEIIRLAKLELGAPLCNVLKSMLAQKGWWSFESSQNLVPHFMEWLQTEKGKVLLDDFAKVINKRPSAEEYKIPENIPSEALSHFLKNGDC